MFSSFVRMIFICLLAEFIWIKLPTWLQISLKFLTFMFVTSMLMLLYRTGVISLFGGIFLEVGGIFLGLIKAMGMLFFYGLTGRYIATTSYGL